MSTTNQMLQADFLGSASWLSANAGIAAPYKASGWELAPNGTLTASRLVIDGGSNGQYSYVYQGGAFSLSESTSSVYFKGFDGGSGTVDLLSGSTPNACVRCSYTGSAWSRCVLNSAGAAAGYMFVGTDRASVVCNPDAGNAGPVDVLVWRAQHETNLSASRRFATSGVYTTTLAASRNEEYADFPGLNLSYSPQFCTAATIDAPATAHGASGGGTLAPIVTRGATTAAVDTSNKYWWPFNTADWPAIDAATMTATGVTGYAPATSTISDGSHRYVARHTGSAFQICYDASCTTSGASTLMSFDGGLTRVKLDAATAAGNNKGWHWISEVQVDATASECTP
jgi:hypothetical protein